MINLQCRLVRHGSHEYEETVALRDAILRRPLDLIFAPESLGAEWSDHHIACYEAAEGGEELVGCLILTPLTEGKVKMRQVAVVEDRQGRGVGRLMVEFSERFARNCGFTEMTLHARDTAVPFYNRLGYTAYGEGFTEVGIPHVAMRKGL